MKTISELCFTVLKEQDEKKEKKRRLFIPKLDCIATMYKYFMILTPHTEPGYLPGDVEIDKTGNWYKSICDAREVKSLRKCRLKYYSNAAHPEQGVASHWVLLNMDMPDNEPCWHAIRRSYHKLFDHKETTLCYDQERRLWWFLDSDNEPYAVVCGIRSAKEGSHIS